MTDTLLTQLQQALAPQYTLERELGGGGMSRVFVALDTALRRRVVVKVLPPEMGAGVNVERFRREIQVAAQLQHPHLVPVLSAGHDDDLLYYTMPYIEGESVRNLLARRGDLPIAEALRLLREVADALAYAHERGVVHRDIKPENILLTTSHAVVADFGIAKALTAATHSSALTSAGMAVGTLAYMAPEQAAGDPHADHRADLYAFGVVAYELLVGHTPFHGMAPQQLIAAHAVTVPKPITEQRPAVPGALGALIMRLLEKRPSDRPQSATEVLRELDSIAASFSGVRSDAPARARGPRGIMRGRYAWAAAAVVVITVAALLVYSSRDTAGTELDPHLVVVAPFRVSGDATLSYLREGMLDLLAAKFTGEGGPRAAEPGAVLNAWQRRAGARDADPGQETAILIARELRGSQLILGSVVGTPQSLTISATLLGVPSARSRTTATVVGPVDSLGVLVDRLAVQLLAHRIGAREWLGNALGTVPLPALRAYLDGRAAYRRGSYEQAAVHFDAAARRDSTFAHAGFGLLQTSNWTPIPDWDFAHRLVERERHRLDARDQLHLDALLSRDTPRAVPFVRQLEKWNTVVQLAPDRAEAWYELGDVYFHFGRTAQVADWPDRARAAFARAVELDSAFSAPLGHLLELAMLQGDRRATRELWHRYREQVAEGELTHFIRWRVALALGDSAELQNFRARLAEMPLSSLLRIAGGMMLEGEGLDDAPAVTRALRTRASSRMELLQVGRTGIAFHRNTGQLGSAERHIEQLMALLPDHQREITAAYGVLDALYWDGDRERGAAGLPLLERAAAAPLSDSTKLAIFWTSCALGHWYAHGDTAATAARYVARMRHTAEFLRAEPFTGELRVCPATIEALLDLQGGRPDGAATQQLEQLLEEAPQQSDEALLVMARIHDARGDAPAALATLRRRPNHWGFGPVYLSTYLREEGRLAEITGDVEGARRAYGHYLHLRQHADSALRGDLAMIRTALSRLNREER